MKKSPKRRAIDYANRIEYYCNNLKVHFERKKFIMQPRDCTNKRLKKCASIINLDMLDYMVNNQVSIPPEYNQVIDEHFCELIK